MVKLARVTRKAARAREMVASIHHINLKSLSGDRNSVDACYRELERLGFRWDSEQREWLNPTGQANANPQVMTFLIGSPSHDPEVAAAAIVDAFEAMGVRVVATELLINLSNPRESVARIEIVQ